MKPGLQIGNQYEFSIEVRPEMQAQFGETVIHPLYSTAAMINHMEWAARQHILPYLETGEEGAGYQVIVKHLAATPLGATVMIRSTVLAVTTQKVVSAVEAWHGSRQVGSGQITQAIVPLHKLYGQSSDSELQNTVEPAEDVPPPAVLISIDGHSKLQLEILKWETGILPCTRYDEWLICKISFTDNEINQQEEGPFLLRYEFEEWMTAIQHLMQGAQSSFQSDFLEPVLKMELSTSAPNVWACTITLGAPSKDTPSPVSRTMQIDRAGFQRFLAQMEGQLTGFPSRL